jgi:hypothetical protein
MSSKLAMSAKIHLFCNEALAFSLQLVSPSLHSNPTLFPLQSKLQGILAIAVAPVHLVLYDWHW